MKIIPLRPYSGAAGRPFLRPPGRQQFPEVSFRRRQSRPRRYAGLVFQAKLLAGIAQLPVVRRPQIGQQLQGHAALPGQGGPFPGQFLIPILQFRRAGPSLPQQMQQPIALFDHSIVALEGFQIEGIALGDEDVEVAAAAGRRPLHQFNILGAEQNGANNAHQVGGPFPHPVDPDLFLHGIAQAAGAAGRFRSGRCPRRRDHCAAAPIWPVDALIAHINRHRRIARVQNAADQGRLPIPGRRKVDQFPLVFGPERAGNRQQIDGFEQSGFALGVAAIQNCHAGRQFQLQPPKVAKVGQCQARKVSHL